MSIIVDFNGYDLVGKDYCIQQYLNNNQNVKLIPKCLSLLPIKDWPIEKRIEFYETADLETYATMFIDAYLKRYQLAKQTAKAGYTAVLNRGWNTLFSDITSRTVMKGRTIEKAVAFTEEAFSSKGLLKQANHIINIDIPGCASDVICELEKRKFKRENCGLTPFEQEYLSIFIEVYRLIYERNDEVATWNIVREHSS